MFVVLHNFFKCKSRFLNVNLKLELIVFGKHTLMFESNCPRILILSYVGLYFDDIVCNKVLIVLLILIHLELKLSFSIFIEGRCVEVNGTFRHHHQINPIYVLVIGLNWQLGLIEFLLT